MRPPLTSVISEGAQGIFSKVTVLRSERSNKKDDECHSFLVKISTKYLFTGCVSSARGFKIQCVLINKSEDKKVGST